MRNSPSFASTDRGRPMSREARGGSGCRFLAQASSGVCDWRSSSPIRRIRKSTPNPRCFRRRYRVASVHRLRCLPPPHPGRLPSRYDAPPDRVWVLEELKDRRVFSNTHIGTGVDSVARSSRSRASYAPEGPGAFGIPEARGPSSKEHIWFRGLPVAVKQRWRRR